MIMHSALSSIIPQAAVLLLAHGPERWLVLRRRGALRLLLHAPGFDRDSFWQDAVARAQTLCAKQEGTPGGVPALKVNLAPCFSRSGLHLFLSERLRTKPEEMLAAFEACLEAEQSAESSL